MADYQPSLGFLTLKQAASRSKYPYSSIVRLVNLGEIPTEIGEDGNRLISADDVEALKLPKGFMSLSQATRKFGYKNDRLNYFIRMGDIRSIKHRGNVYVSRQDVRDYYKPPKGFLSLDEAVRISGQPEKSLKLLAWNGKIGITKKYRVMYVSKEDVNNYFPLFFKLSPNVKN